MTIVRSDEDGSRAREIIENDSISQPGCLHEYCDEKRVPESVMDENCLNLIAQYELMV
jgi:hypothetical protein